MTTSIAYRIPGRARDLGELVVRRVLPAGRHQSVGPFLFFDHMGPVDFPSGAGIDVRPHPHIGLATVTYLFEGAIRHHDSLGNDQEIIPGDVNWMTAGRGIAHAERTPADKRASGWRLHGIQTWVALPLADEKCEPSFAHHAASTLPLIRGDGYQLRIIAGRAFGQEAPVKVHSPTLYVAAEMHAGAQFTLAAEYPQQAVYVASGSVTIDGNVLEMGVLAVLEPGVAVQIAASEASQVMLLGGAPIDGPRTIWWNFVASDPALIEAAKADWREERFDPVPGDDERIPLPEA
ncbi:pirin family protein [Collimonas arenae]|uniref:Pirin family protein n=1 Tax=Collimonas arenae TaxID=279058 RepID=A0A127PNQ1_9BURK|nr:pirin family protein [Collimonas arenae]AMO99426.1 pirin family protein [Collimonas arenae]AMP09327.1 pirin family protein [Collimonas arenae]